MEYITSYVNSFMKMKPRKLFAQFIVLGMVISSALMIWKSLMLITNCESPIVVVLTGSMEPHYHRGDILFITHDFKPPVPGDVVVYKIPGQEIPIVHRTISTQLLENGDFNCLTKGDANPVNDRDLYDRKALWLNKTHVFGKIKGFLPYIGILTILLNDYPKIKWFILNVMGLMVITSNDPQDN